MPASPNWDTAPGPKHLAALGFYAMAGRADEGAIQPCLQNYSEAEGEDSITISAHQPFHLLTG